MALTGTHLPGDTGAVADANLRDLAIAGLTAQIASQNSTYVPWSPAPSGDVTGVTDTAAIQAMEDSLSAAGGGTIYWREGTYWTTGLTKRSNVMWQGVSRFATILTLANNSNRDVVQGADFATLTLSGSNTGGIGGWGIRDMVIDGNRANQTGTSYCLRVYAYMFDLTHVSLRGALTDGLYTEWGDFGGYGTPDNNMHATYEDLIIHNCAGNGWRNRGPHDSRVYGLTIFDNDQGGVGYWGEANGNASVAVGSNGVDLSTFTAGSPGTLNVASTVGYPDASINATQGSLTVVTALGNAVLTFTGKSATAFTGCVAQGSPAAGSTVATGASVTPTGGRYSAAGVLLVAPHVYGIPLWNYILDCQTHLIDGISEAGAEGGGMVLIRGSDSQIVGGKYVVYAGIPQLGCGIQIGDTINSATGLRIDTVINGLAGTSAATSAINVVKDGGGNAVDAFVYQPTGVAISGTLSNGSRYRIHSSATASLQTQLGTHLNYLPVASTSAWTLKDTASKNFLNLNTTNSRIDHCGVVDRWYVSGFTTTSVNINGADGSVQPGTLTGTGGRIFSGSGAPTISATSGDFYLRTGTPTTANQRLYICTGTTNWTGIL